MHTYSLLSIVQSCSIMVLILQQADTMHSHGVCEVTPREVLQYEVANKSQRMVTMVVAYTIFMLLTSLSNSSMTTVPSGVM